MKRITKVVAVTLMSFCLVLPLGISVQAAGTDIVYIAPRGEKYHKQGCSTLSRSKHLTQLTVDEALARGCTPCKVCSPGGSASSADTSVQTTSAAPAAPAASNAAITANQAVQNAYALYVQHGFNSSDAMSRVQSILPKIATDPANYEQLVNADLSAAVSSTAAAASSITADQAVQKAYALYVQAGLDSSSAMTHIQGILAQLAASPDDYVQLVQNDLAKISGTSASSAKPTAEQLVQQLYAQLISQGLSSDQAMAQINAQLPSILAQAAA